MYIKKSNIVGLPCRGVKITILSILNIILLFEYQNLDPDIYIIIYNNFPMI
jgi:hypothetical protein